MKETIVKEVLKCDACSYIIDNTPKELNGSDWIEFKDPKNNDTYHVCCMECLSDVAFDILQAERMG
jgi:hypothetical protein